MLKPYRETLLGQTEPVRLIARPHAFTFWSRAIVAIVTIPVCLVAAFAIEQTALLPAGLVAVRPYLTVVLLVLALLALISALSTWVRWRAHEIVVTDRRVVRITGMLSKEVIDYSLDAITDLRLRQSWLGRIFDYGDVDILTASESASIPRDTFPVVSEPIKFMHAVQDERERRRMRIITGGMPPNAPAAELR